MSNFNKFLTMISTEFNRYLMGNERLTKDIPKDALIIFQVEGEDDFNKWHKEMSLKNREKGQPIIYVKVKEWRQRSIIKKVDLAEVA